MFQRRQAGSVDFYRGWNDYKSGFGQLTAEFWLGNDKIHRLMATKPSTLRVELEDWNGVRVYAKYDKFIIGDEQALYRLDVDAYSGTAGDSLFRQGILILITWRLPLKTKIMTEAVMLTVLCYTLVPGGTTHATIPI